MQRSYECQRVLALQERKRAVLGSFSAEGNGDSEAELRRRLEAVERHFDFPRSALAVQLSTARAGPDPRGPDAPVPPGDDARFRVFADLRRRGFYLTSAGKFGGDFLVYPGRGALGPAGHLPTGLQRQEDGPPVLAARRRRRRRRDVLLAHLERHGLRLKVPWTARRDGEVHGSGRPDGKPIQMNRDEGAGVGLQEAADANPLITLAGHLVLLNALLFPG
ncbi:tRNA-splicing endonuclease subunit Sen34 isoform X3 [Stigmatopora nigra]